MHYSNSTTNDVKGARTRRNGSSSGKGSVSWHAHLGRYNASAKQHYRKVASLGSQRRHFKKGKELNLSFKSPRKKIILGSINVRTCKEESMLFRTVHQCKALNQAFTFIQETHMPGYGTVKYDDAILNGWRFVYSGFQVKARAGVGIVLSPHAKLIEDKVWLEGRILSARIIVNGVKISAICGYSPTDASAQSSKHNFYAVLDKTIKSIKESYPSCKLIIGGDMNATIGNDNDNFNCLGKNNDPLPTNGNGEPFESV